MLALTSLPEHLIGQPKRLALVRGSTSTLLIDLKVQGKAKKTGSTERQKSYILTTIHDIAIGSNEVVALACEFAVDRK